MQMRHSFAASRTIVDDEAITALFQAQLAGDGGGFEEQMAERGLVGVRGFGDARNGFLGDDDDVRGRLRVDVAEGQHDLVFINNRRRDFAGDDFLKKGFAHA